MTWTNDIERKLTEAERRKKRKDQSLQERRELHESIGAVKEEIAELRAEAKELKSVKVDNPQDFPVAKSIEVENFPDEVKVSNPVDEVTVKNPVEEVSVKNFPDEVKISNPVDEVSVKNWPDFPEYPREMTGLTSAMLDELRELPKNLDSKQKEDSQPTHITNTNPIDVYLVDPRTKQRYRAEGGGSAYGPTSADTGGDVTATLNPATVLHYGEITSVGASATTTIVTSPSNGIRKITKILCSGTCYAKYLVYIDNVVKMTARSGPDRTVTFDFMHPLRINSSSVLDIKVIHYVTGEQNDFEASIIGY